MRVTSAHRRDFYVYLRWRRAFPGFMPWRHEPITRGISDTVAAFVEIESRGVMPAPKHPRVLAAVIEGKRLLNFQIKQWAEGAAFYLGQMMPHVALSEEEELRSGYPFLPEWVWLSVRSQAAKIVRRQAGLP